MSRGVGTRSAALLAVAVLAACSGGRAGATNDDEVTMQLTSAAFTDGASIPSRHTCDGEDVSPPLEWTDPPPETASYALVVDDPDAGGFVHWVLTDIPSDARELPEGEGDAIATAGPTGFGSTGWGGPCPPSGEHRYVFTLYALTEPIGELGDADALRAAAGEGRTLATATLTGTYARR